MSAARFFTAKSGDGNEVANECKVGIGTGRPELRYCPRQSRGVSQETD
jgi:hypothetical protein